MNTLLEQLITEDEECLCNFQSDVVLELSDIYENYENDYKTLADLRTQIKEDLFISIKENDYVLTGALSYILSQL